MFLYLILILLSMPSASIASDVGLAVAAVAGGGDSYGWRAAGKIGNLLNSDEVGDGLMHQAECAGVSGAVREDELRRILEDSKIFKEDLNPRNVASRLITGPKGKRVLQFRDLADGEVIETEKSTDSDIKKESILISSTGGVYYAGHEFECPESEYFMATAYDGELVSKGISDYIASLEKKKKEAEPKRDPVRYKGQSRRVWPKCKHAGHVGCFRRYVDMSKEMPKCPICRAPAYELEKGEVLPTFKESFPYKPDYKSDEDCSVCLEPVKPRRRPGGVDGSTVVAAGIKRNRKSYGTNRKKGRAGD